MNDRLRFFEALKERFGESFSEIGAPERLERLVDLADHRTQRTFLDKKISLEAIRMLCACALSAPSKSDLQQSDIVIIADPDLRKRIADLMPNMPWIGKAPAFVIVCMDGSRLLEISKLRGKPFPNDHLDLFFNAATDAAIVLAWLQASVDLCGWGGCPVSEIRNHAPIVSQWLQLPDRVIPYAGFCFGIPDRAPSLTPRLPLSTTVHMNTFNDASFHSDLIKYDARRRSYSRQRDPDKWGISDPYGWSEDKARQYAVPLRDDFGSFVRSKNFKLT